MNAKRRVRTYRVSVFDEFVHVIDWPDRPDLPALWAVWDESYIVPRLIDQGRGEVPIGYFPLGLKPSVREASANGGSSDVVG